MYKFMFFVPVDYADLVKQAVFKAGAGKLGNYSECSWETLGTGQFKPMSGSNPFLGDVDVLETVSELNKERDDILSQYDQRFSSQMLELTQLMQQLEAKVSIQ